MSRARLRLCVSYSIFVQAMRSLYIPQRCKEKEVKKTVVQKWRVDQRKMEWKIGEGRGHYKGKRAQDDDSETHPMS